MRIITSGNSDVKVMLHAARHIYHLFLTHGMKGGEEEGTYILLGEKKNSKKKKKTKQKKKTGIEIYEMKNPVLHSKVFFSFFFFVSFSF